MTDEQLLGNLGETVLEVSAVMTGEQLAAMESRAQAAPSGPWTFDEQTLWDATERILATGPSCSERLQPEVFVFCAHARNDVPALLAEVRRLKTALAAILRANQQLAQAFEEQRQALLHALGQPEVR